MILIKFLSYLPLSWLHFMARILAFVAFRVVGYRKTVVRKNLKNSFPEKTEQERTQIEKAFYCRFTEVFAELIKSYSFSEADWKKRCKLVNHEQMKKSLDEGRPLLLMGGHLANWEWPVHAISLGFEQPIEFLYKPVTNKVMNNILTQLRCKTGGRAINKDIAFREIMKRRNEPRVVSFISDQTPSWGANKQWFSFLNQATPFYQGAEKMAKALNYPVFYGETIRLRPGYYEVRLHKIAEPPYDDQSKIIEKYVGLLEKSIQNDPTAYYWLHKRWKYTRIENDRYLEQLKSKTQ